MNPAIYQRVFTMIGEDLIDNSFDEALTEERKLQYATVHSAMHLDINGKPSKDRYFVIKIEERNGEREYIIPYLHSVSNRCRKTAQEIAEGVAKTWYADRDRKTFMEGWYTFEGCQLAARVHDVKQITEAEYSTLLKYL